MQHVNCFLWGERGLVILPDVKGLSLTYRGPAAPYGIGSDPPRRYVVGPRRWSAWINPDRVYGILTERSLQAGPHPALLAAHDPVARTSWEFRGYGYVTCLGDRLPGGRITAVRLELSEGDWIGQPI